MAENGNNLLVQGRIVWGANLFEGKQKLDYNTGVPVLDKVGNPAMEYGFGLAIPKNDPATGQPSAEFTKVWAALHAEAYTLYPSGQLPPDFAMKYKDGDGVDHNGKPFADREGHAGHIILTCTTQIPIKWFIYNNGNNELVNTGVKCGDYVDVQLNLKAHPAKGKGKAGLYLNPSAVRLVQAGAEIINAPSGDQIFGAVAPVAIPGAVAYVAPAMPGVAPLGQPMGAAMGAPANAQVHAQPGTVAPPMPVQAAPQVAPVAAPNYGVLPPAHQPAQTTAPVVAPVGMPVAPPMPVQAAPQVAPVAAPNYNVLPTVHQPAQVVPVAAPLGVPVAQGGMSVAPPMP